MSERKRTCPWCAHGRQVNDQDTCTLYPEWRYFEPLSGFTDHYCGQHKWNRKANDEISEEIFAE